MEITPSFLHKLYRGKWGTTVRVPISGNLHVYYTPGVAQPCQDIAADKELVWSLTNRWNTIGVISNGTRILGLGDIGPEAGLPVMEGKAALYKYYAGIDALPLCIKASSEEGILSFVRAIEPSLGGINLEDIKQPDAFHVLTAARNDLEIPIIHDDMEGTAIVILTALLSAVTMMGLRLEDERIVLLGAGSANMGFLQLLDALTGDVGNVVVVDKDQTYGSDNASNHWMSSLLRKTNLVKKHSLEQALKGASILIAASRPGPGVFPVEYIKNMKKPRAVFSLANPIPEISREEAENVGVDIYASGRSDEPNQVNNSLIFPGLMLGLLVTRKQYNAEVGTDIASSLSLSSLSEGKLIPAMDSNVHAHIAECVVNHFSSKADSKQTIKWKDELSWRLSREQK
ncbi:NAD(P)-dependent malic enzyme [Coprothermobacter platensis]|uniref:NAD(P)-dependent malic enzyme n=1 Tax=Coprothermobacter platensis TaxID=108819 RepID=UPI000377E935|nr:malic enzyme-like NAD(P)-binding protein [Coprothermobacter platensis]